MVPSTQLKDIIFWSTIAFSLSGLESASMMGDEIENARRNIPRALLLAGGLITGMYILSTVAMLVALPPGQIRNLEGFMQSIATMSGRVGLGWLTTVAAVFIFLGQAGTTVRGAYDVLVSMAIISYFIPYLFIFGSMVRLQREPAGAGVIRVPGGRPVAVLLATIGFGTTAVAIVLACIPAEREPNKVLAVTKVVGLTVALVVVGAMVYVVGRRTAHDPGATPAHGLDETGRTA
jgi:amino acid transporter